MNILIDHHHFCFQILIFGKIFIKMQSLFLQNTSDFHSNKYYKKKVDDEILVIFFKDIIENSDETSYQNIKSKKINKLISLIENKLKKIKILTL